MNKPLLSRLAGCVLMTGLSFAAPPDTPFAPDEHIKLQ